MMGSWGTPGGISKETTPTPLPPPPPESVCYCTKGEMCILWGLEGCNTMQSLAPSCLVCPQRPGGHSLGKGLQPL